MKFEKIILWCEFPESVNWKKAESLMKNIPYEIYIASKSKREFLNWKKKTSLNVYPWPILPKSEGYWFSGFTSKKGINQLNQYKGIKMKIDLEPPIPKWKYNSIKFIFYGMKKLFQKGKNSEYLKQTILNLSKKGEILINEFPVPRWYLEKQGMYIDTKDNKNLTKNIMTYNTTFGFLRPIVRFYMKSFAKRAIKNNPKIMFSIGLIGTGILQTEGHYSHPRQLKQDLEMINKIGAKKVAVYSLDSILKRKNPEEWVNQIRGYV